MLSGESRGDRGASKVDARFEEPLEFKGAPETTCLRVFKEAQRSPYELCLVAEPAPLKPSVGGKNLRERNAAAFGESRPDVVRQFRGPVCEARNAARSVIAEDQKPTVTPEVYRLLKFEM